MPLHIDCRVNSTERRGEKRSRLLKWNEIDDIGKRRRRRDFNLTAKRRMKRRKVVKYKRRRRYMKKWKTRGLNEIHLFSSSSKRLPNIGLRAVIPFHFEIRGETFPLLLPLHSPMFHLFPDYRTPVLAYCVLVIHFSETRIDKILIIET